MIDPIKKRRSVRLKKYDYSHSGAYYITICSHAKKCLFGEVVENRVVLTPLGMIITECWGAIPSHFPSVDLDSFVIMPNHFHGILVFGSCRGEACLAPTGPRKQKLVLGNVIGSFKSAISKRFHENQRTWLNPVWQRNYYEHVIRGEKDMEKIREYIVNNPLQWAMDEENPNRYKGEACLAPTRIQNQKSRNRK